MVFKVLSAALLTLSTVVLSHGQVTYNETTNTYTCPARSSGGSFCGGGSSSPISTRHLIRCAPNSTAGTLLDCADALDPLVVVGLVRHAASCHQFSPAHGDAACAFNGVAYPRDAAPFPICGARAAVVSGVPAPSVNATTAFRTGPSVTSSSSRRSSSSSSSNDDGGAVEYADDDDDDDDGGEYYGGGDEWVWDGGADGVAGSEWVGGHEGRCVVAVGWFVWGCGGCG
ncbi:hypothetical protein GTA08_BOTSDO03701 [Botryosphaeria dothidea]|uniref:Uncharacterized protein n=1 Tax=Botryosphaeria dothidea TaxID=55169 RepID=A0A8H4N6R5_9PEZI|nr:hypothetical protein GTA08_BOTSDO03701 [Botryosphaeria dothidea]